MLKKITVLSYSFVLLMLVSSRADAATLTAGPLTITYSGSGSIFSESNLSPGDSIRREVTIKNNGTIAHNFAIATKNVSGELGSVIAISAIEGSATLWTNTLQELQSVSTASKFVTRLSSGQTKMIAFVANFPSSADASVAGKNVTFDIIYGTEESEPVARGFSIFSTNPSPTVTPSETPTVSVSVSPDGEVKGESTSEDSSGLDPWFLVIAPAAVIASVVFWPEFIFAGGTAIVSGGLTYVLGYSSSGNMNPMVFYTILIFEMLAMILIAYFILHHDNRASRKIKAYHHRLRIK